MPQPKAVRTFPSTHTARFAPLRGRFFRHNKPGGAPKPETLPAITRRDEATLAPDEQQRFVSAISTLIGNGFFGKYVAIHADMKHRMHSMEGSIGTQRFLPWHRVYLLDLERELRTIDHRIFIPYWDWVAARNIPAWLQNFTPQVDVNGRIIHVVRHPGAFGPLPTHHEVDQALAPNNYTSFTSALENVHNAVHMFVGGTMSSIPTAPADPIFWMHHANIDRLWNQWQGKHAGVNPNLAGKDAVMDPWKVTEPQTRSIASLGYQY